MKPVTDRDDPPAPVRYDTRTKRLVRYILDPWNIALACCFALVYAALFYHRLNTGNFWIGYVGWQLGAFSFFWLHEAYRWAGGKR